MNKFYTLNFSSKIESNFFGVIFLYFKRISDFGTQFNFSLISKNENAGDISKPETIRDSYSKKEINAFVVDNDDDFRIAFVVSLMEITNYDMNIVETDSGKDALKQLEKDYKKYDVVFVDLVMPEINGIDIYEKLRQLGFKKRIVVMSSELYSLEAKTAEERNIEIHDKNKLYLEFATILSHTSQFLIDKESIGDLDDEQGFIN